YVRCLRDCGRCTYHHRRRFDRDGERGPSEYGRSRAAHREELSDRSQCPCRGMPARGLRFHRHRSIDFSRCEARLRFGSSHQWCRSHGEPPMGVKPPVVELIEKLLEVRCSNKAMNTAVTVYVGSTNHALVCDHPIDDLEAVNRAVRELNMG